MPRGGVRSNGAPPASPRPERLLQALGGAGEHASPDVRAAPLASHAAELQPRGAAAGAADWCELADSWSVPPHQVGDSSEVRGRGGLLPQSRGLDTRRRSPVPPLAPAWSRRAPQRGRADGGYREEAAAGRPRQRSRCAGGAAGSAQDGLRGLRVLAVRRHGGPKPALLLHRRPVRPRGASLSEVGSRQCDVPRIRPAARTAAPLRSQVPFCKVPVSPMNFVGLPIFLVESEPSSFPPIFLTHLSRPPLLSAVWRLRPRRMASSQTTTREQATSYTTPPLIGARAARRWACCHSYVTLATSAADEATAKICSLRAADAAARPHLAVHLSGNGRDAKPRPVRAGNK
mmetsp:Transcript_22201/g.70956  ORF Transcript_22201/g.70956 Transcript_22201/m.70956 type:complete len:345 (-) Transcript_22201:37-1071(-)